MMNIVAKHKIGDMVIHKVSKKEHLVIWYSYVESRWLSYIIIWDDQKELYAIWFELEDKNDEYALWFKY